jgi:glyoxylase-like metal-dependent hydrolase (beta-lactamase superfamily II)
MARIIPLTEGSFTVDATKKFVPFDAAQDTMGERGQGALLVEIQPFLVVTARDCLLMDTGLGFRDEQGGLWLHRHLREHGFSPADVTKVLVSHLHKDHAGGIAGRDEQGKAVAAFPAATYYVNGQELSYALSHAGSSYHPEQFSFLQDNPQTVLTEGDGAIDGYIRFMTTGGHSPWHQVFRVEDSEGIYFFGGDVAPQLSQMKTRFAAKYDYDGRKSMELRQQYLEEGKKEGWTFLFYHDIRTPSFRFR